MSDTLICNYCYHPAHCDEVCSHQYEADEFAHEGQPQEGTCGCKQCQCDTCMSQGLVNTDWKPE